jgi:hypothetical protein
VVAVLAQHAYSVKVRTFYYRIGGRPVKPSSWHSATAPRAPDAQDRRRVLVQLTPRGEAVLRELSVLHHTELLSAAPALLAALQDVLAPTLVRQSAEVAWPSSIGAQH